MFFRTTVFLAVSLFPLVFLGPRANAGSGDFVAQVTIRDVAGSTKTNLTKTTARKCDRRRRQIVKELQRTVGIAEIVSSKCGPIGAMIGFFMGMPMGVPYVWMVDTILILNGASHAACEGLAVLTRQTNPNAKCVFS